MSKPSRNNRKTRRAQSQSQGQSQPATSTTATQSEAKSFTGGLDGDAGWSTYGGTGMFGGGMGGNQSNIALSRFRTPAEQAGAFTADDTVHACVSIIAETIARLKWKLRHRKTGTVVEEASHASTQEIARTTRLFEDSWELKQFQTLTALLRNPNPYQSWFEFMALQQMYFGLTGNALALKDNPNELGWPEFLWPLNPNWTQPIVEADEGLIGYYYLSGNTTLAAEPDYICHAKEVNPVSIFWGMSKLAVASGILDAQVGIDDYQRGFFANGAVLSGIISAPGTPDPKTFKQLKSEIKEQFQGARNHFKIALLTAGMSWQNVSLSQTDMGMIEWKKFGQERIRQLYRVPQSKLGNQDDAQYNKLDAANRTYYLECITPLAEMWQRKLSEITGAFGWDFEFDVPIFDDVASILDIVGKVDNLKSLSLWEKRQTMKRLANRHLILEDDPDAPMSAQSRRGGHGGRGNGNGYGSDEDEQPGMHYIYGPDGVTPIAQLGDGGKTIRYLPGVRIIEAVEEEG